MPDEDIRYLIRSPRFAREFDTVKAETLLAEVQRQCRGHRGPLGAGQFLLTDDRGEAHVFRFEAFFNGHDALTWATRVSARPVSAPVAAVRRP